MNLKHPYEKHLAEKLVQLPPPDDPDQNWQQMKMLLDKNMPRGGRGPNGSFRWWVAGIIIIAVVVGTWFGGKSLLTKEGSNERVAGTIKTVNNKNKPSVASAENNVEQGNDGRANSANKKNLPGAAYASATNSEENNRAVTNDQQTITENTSGAKGELVSKNDIATTNSSTRNNNNASPAATAEKARSSGNDANASRIVTGNNNSTGASNNPTGNHNKTSVDRNKIYTSDKANDKVSAGSNNTTNNRSAKEALNVNNSNRNQRSNNTVASSRGNATSSRSNNSTKKPVKKSGTNVNKPSVNDGAASRYTYKPTISLPSQPSTGSGLKESPVTYNVNYTGTTVVSPSGVIQREFTYYTGADLVPELAVKKKSSTRKSNRNKNDQEDKTFAVGLSLPMGFPVGDQQPLAFNRNAGVNTISDYIPSPHFQYHFNKKTYVQAGLQISSPQFIRPVLLYQDRKVSQPPFVHEQITTWTARKLYYFNLPLTVYHSPLKNFYMGTGLQYSRMLSGVAQYECIERNTVGPAQQLLIKNYFSKFKNDSLSSKLNTNEVRLLIDLSYYWSRFTVGLQYSQAFNNYVSFQVTPNSPYTFDKNKSLQFYLRYNIWEDVKRKKPKGEVLTLK